MSIYAFFDNDPAKIGRKISGIEILSPQLIKQNPNDYFIILAMNLGSMSYVRDQLLNYGVNGQDIAYYVPKWTMDFDLFGNEKFLGTFIEAFSNAFHGIPLTKIDISSLSYWIAALELSKDLCKWILCNFSGKKNLRMLDIGPGMGVQSIIMRKMLDVDITWIDVCDVTHTQKEFYGNNRQYLENELNIHIIEGNVETIQYKFEEGFDIIFFSEVLEHFKYHPVGTMKKILSWLKNDGRLYLGMPNYNITKKYRTYDSWRDMPIYDAENQKELCNYWMHVLEYRYEEAIDLFNELNLHIEKNASSSNGAIMEFELSKILREKMI